MSRSKIIAAFLFAATIAGAFLYVNPLIERHTLVVEEVTAKEAKVEESAKAKEEAQKVKREFDALSRADKDRYLNAFPATVEQEGIINDIVGIAETAGLSLASLSFSKNLNQSTPKRLSIVANISGSGDPSAVLGLVKGIEQANRLLSVRGISFLLGKGRQDYTLTLEAYYK